MAELCTDKYRRCTIAVCQLCEGKEPITVLQYVFYIYRDRFQMVLTGAHASDPHFLSALIVREEAL